MHVWDHGVVALLHVQGVWTERLLHACIAQQFPWHRRQLAGWGERAVATGLGIEEYHETTRDTHDFGRRVGQLPEQRETDGEVDYRSLLHRDGSVLSAITLEVATPPPSQHRTKHMFCCEQRKRQTHDPSGQLGIGEGCLPPSYGCRAACEKVTEGCSSVCWSV